MRTMYETEADLSRESDVRTALAEAIEGELHKLPLSYGVDAMGVNNEGGLFGWFEIKCRPGMTWGQYPDVMISVLKLRAAAGLKVATGADTFFAVSDSAGEIRVFNLCNSQRGWIRFGGRTSQTRDSADVEPVCHIPVDRFHSLKEVSKWAQ